MVGEQQGEKTRGHGELRMGTLSMSQRRYESVKLAKGVGMTLLSK